MKKIIKSLLAIIIIGLIAAAVIISLLPAVISTDALRIRVAQQISAWTGYSAELKQAPSLTFFPQPKASFGSVVLSSVHDHGKSEFMSADQIILDLSLWDALFGKISFSETLIINPHFNLGETMIDPAQFINALSASDGRLGTAIRAEKSLQSDKAADPNIGLRTAQPFGKIIIRNGSLTHQNFNSANEEITGINATVDWPNTQSAFSLQGSAKWNEEQTRFELTSPDMLRLLAGGDGSLNAILQAKPLSLDFNGKANFSENYKFSGKVKATTPEPSQALAWLGLALPMRAANIGAINAETNITNQQQRFVFSDIILEAKSGTVKGTLEVASGDKTPQVSGTLAFQHLDLSALIGAFVPLPDRHYNPENYSIYHREELASNDIINTNFMQNTEFDLRLSAQNAVAGPVNLNNIAAAIQVTPSRANFDIGDAKAFKGSIATNISIIRDLNGANGELRFNATDIDSAEMLQLMGIGNPPIYARGNISLSLKAPLTYWSQLAKSADGTLSLNLANGQIKGLDFQNFIKQLQTQQFFALQETANINLNFNRLDVKANITDGVATLDAANIQIADSSIKLAGIIPITNRSLALSGVLTLPEILTKATDNQAASNENSAVLNTDSKPKLQFFVGGSWDRPFVSASTQ